MNLKGVFEKAVVYEEMLWPRHLMARVGRHAFDSEWPPLRSALIRSFLRTQPVDMSDALIEDPFAYPSFASFFGRELRPGARTIAPGSDELASPVDGMVASHGDIHDGSLIQAKGREFTLAALLASAFPQNPSLHDGDYLTIYLAKHDYHRVHAPMDCTLLRTTYVPGRLFSVNPRSAESIDDLYARNERLICEFGASFGTFVLVMVGAGFVSGIETRWEPRTPHDRRRASCRDHRGEGISFAKGEEIGTFRLGSTVVLVLPARVTTWDDGVANGSKVRMGQALARVGCVG